MAFPQKLVVPICVRQASAALPRRPEAGRLPCVQVAARAATGSVGGLPPPAVLSMAPGRCPENFCAAVCLVFAPWLSRIPLGLTVRLWVGRKHIARLCAGAFAQCRGAGNLRAAACLAGEGNIFLAPAPGWVHLRACAFRRHLRSAPSFLMSGPEGRFRAR